MSLIADDPMLMAMQNPSIKWGDLFWPDIQRMEEERYNNLPKIGHRKDIWVNFPVHVIPVGFDKDGHELHKIVWNKKCEYSDALEMEMLQAIQRCDRWTVHYSEDKNILAVLRMKQVGNHARSEDVCFHTKPRELKTIQDISKHYPVVWTMLPDNTIGLSIHRKNVSNFMKRKGYNCLNEVVNNLYTAIQANKSWRILDGSGIHFMRIQITAE